jgi:hypothetical protein
MEVQVKRSSIFTQEIFNKVAWVSFSIAAVYIVIHLFVIGGDSFIITLSDTLPIPLAILNAVLVFIMWQKFAPLNKGRKLWGWFVIGWSLWALGEILYVVIGFLTDEVPYPSVADIAYIVGTILLIGGLVRRVQDTPHHMKRLQIISFWLIAIALMAIVYFLALQPILRADAGSGLGLILLDVFYPLSDLLILLLAIRLLFDYDTRSSSLGWVLVIVGFILITVADLMYSYLYSSGLYYPNDQVNLVTSVGSSIPYVLGYLFTALGIYRLQIKQEIVIKEEELVQPAMVENTHIVFFVDSNLNIDEASVNVSALIRGSIKSKDNFAALLKLKPEERDTILDALRLKGTFSDLQVQVSNARNELIPARISGISLHDPQKNFIGGLLVLRMVSPVNNLDNHLTEYQASIAKQVKLKSGSREENAVCDFLCSYYSPLFDRLREMAFQFGGAQQGVNFMDFINQEAAQNKWKLKVAPNTLEALGTVTPGELANDLNALMAAAQSQLERMTDRATIDKELKIMTAKFTDDVINNLRYIEHTWVTHEDQK